MSQPKKQTKLHADDKFLRVLRGRGWEGDDLPRNKNQLYDVISKYARGALPVTTDGAPCARGDAPASVLIEAANKSVDRTKRGERVVWGAAPPALPPPPAAAPARPTVPIVQKRIVAATRSVEEALRALLVLTPKPSEDELKAFFERMFRHDLDARDVRYVDVGVILTSINATDPFRAAVVALYGEIRTTRLEKITIMTLQTRTTDGEDLDTPKVLGSLAERFGAPLSGPSTATATATVRRRRSIERRTVQHRRRSGAFAREDPSEPCALARILEVPDARDDDEEPLGRTALVSWYPGAENFTLDVSDRRRVARSRSSSASVADAST